MTRIIRAPGPAMPRRRDPERTRVLRAHQLQSLQEAEELLQAARQQAAALIEQATAEAAELRHRAEQESQTKAAALLCRADERAAQVVSEARQELTTLAVRIAEKILGEQLRLQPDSVCSIVQRCLQAAPSARRVRLRANPDDLPLLEAARPHLGSLASLQLCADPQITRGGCVLESELGEVDARLEVQLARLAEALR